MTTKLRDALAAIEPDRWRRERDFSDDIRAAHEGLFGKAVPDAVVAATLGGWLAKQQPCVFGRVAARIGALDYCIVRESDAIDSDERVFQKVQDGRAAWKSRALAGQSSGFVILLLSETIARGEPSPVVMTLAAELCRLYLVADDIQPDQIYLDQIELGVPTAVSPSAALAFDVGVNYFSAQGDGRWWADHRIPGGLAFSMNSVGHFVRSGIVKLASDQLQQEVFGSADDGTVPKLASLGEALRWAMQTIRNAGDGPSGAATSLRMAMVAKDDRPKCPIELPKGLAGFDHCGYEGWYHTDVTLPLAYFQPEVERPPSAPRLDLDFTYLFDERLDNPAFYRMGRGVRVRKLSPEESEGALSESLVRAAQKRGRARGVDRSL